MYSLASRAAIISKYGPQAQRAQSASIRTESAAGDDLEDDDIESRIASSMSRHSLVEMLEESQGRSSRMRTQSAMSTSSAGSHRARTPYGGDLDEFYPLEEVDLDMQDEPNFEVMLSRHGRIEHIGSATSRTDSPFMRSVSQMTGRVASSRAGERSAYGSVLGDVEAELIQGRGSGLDDEMITSEVGLPVSPEWLGRLARPNTAEGNSIHEHFSFHLCGFAVN